MRTFSDTRRLHTAPFCQRPSQKYIPVFPENQYAALPVRFLRISLGQSSSTFYYIFPSSFLPPSDKTDRHLISSRCLQTVSVSFYGAAWEVAPHFPRGSTPLHAESRRKHRNLNIIHYERSTDVEYSYGADQRPSTA